MGRRKKSPKYQLMTGIASFTWAELKTMNWTKIKSLWQIIAAKIRMKFAGSARINKSEMTKQQMLRETTFRLSS